MKILYVPVAVASLIGFYLSSAVAQEATAEIDQSVQSKTFSEPPAAAPAAVETPLSDQIAAAAATTDLEQEQPPAEIADISAQAAPASVLVDVEDAGEEVVSAVVEEVATEAAPIENAADDTLETPHLTRFNRSVYSLADVSKTTIFGAALDMATDEVYDALIARNFVEPVTGVSPSLGYFCEDYSDESPCNTPGYSQTQTYVWARGDEIDIDGTPIPTEQVLPFFYLDREGVQRLYSLQYIKQFAEPVDLQAARDLYQNRFGVATDVRVTTDQIEMRYVVQAEVPDGLTPTPRDQRMPSQWALQRAVTATLSDCVEQQLTNPTSGISLQCQRVLSGDERSQDVFEALSNTVIKTDQSNAFLGIVIEPQRTKIYLIGRYLPEAELLFVERKTSLTKLEAARETAAAAKAAEDAATEAAALVEAEAMAAEAAATAQAEETANEAAAEANAEIVADDL